MPQRAKLPGRAAAAVAVAAALGVFPIAVSASDATQVVSQTFAPVADAFVSSSQPSTNYGTAPRLKMDASPVLTTYVRFNVSNLTGPITRATLQVYSRASSNAGFDLRAVANNTWAENTITYANAPAFSSSSSGLSGIVKYGRWATFDVTPLISGNGLVSIALTTPSRRELDVDSREGANAPKLTVETASGDVTAPTAPASLTVTSAAATSLALSWSASTDDTGVTGYDVFLNGTKVDSTTSTGYSFGSLVCGTTYTLGVEAFDAAGHHSARSSIDAATSACAADTQPPSAPTSLAASSVTPTSLTLSWHASTDNVGVAGYDVFLNGTKVNSTATATTYLFGSLSCGTKYTLGVKAFDAAGNRSSLVSLDAATSACVDGQAPSVPTNLAVSAPGQTSFGLSWTASTDNVGVTGYDVYANGVKVAGTAATSYTFSGLLCGTTYTVGVEAFDAAGNRSARASVAASTTACSGGSVPVFRYAYFGDADPTANKNLGATLIDVGSKSAADALPAGLQGMVWVGDYNNTTCSWQISDSSLSSAVTAAKGDAKVRGWFFSDEPNPLACPTAPAQHKARSDLIHSLDPSTKTFIVLDSNGFAGNLTQDAIDQIPLWLGTADFIGLDPYPCLVNKACDYTFISNTITKADAVGIPYVGVLQAFDGTGAGEPFRQPTASELQTMVNLWARSHEVGSAYFAWDWPAANWYLKDHPDLESVIQNFYTGSNSADTTPPSAPTGLTEPAATATSVSLAWTASIDNVGVAGYDLYVNGVKVASTAGTQYTFGSLACGTSYTLGVDAYDAAGNVSPRSSVTGSTTTCAVTTSDPVITAAGDICGSPTDCAPTEKLLETLAPTRVLTLGDNAYPDGSSSDYTTNYEPNWGKQKAKTSPAPGNHDYHTAGAAGYFGYFGAQAPAPYYSFDLGSWHLISLNGEVGVSVGSAQETWLKNDLAAHPAQCILAYWHEPRFSSGAEHGSDPSFDAFWRDLYAAGADIVLNGHDHDYERFAPQNPDAVADPHGIREFVVGTGGDSHYTFGTPIANSAIRDNTSFGVLKLTLHPGSYDWQFVPIAGASFTDAGSGTC